MGRLRKVLGLLEYMNQDAFGKMIHSAIAFSKRKKPFQMYTVLRK